MSTFKSTYHSKIYRDFKALDERAYRDMVRFYEEREDDIKGLEFQEFFELLFAYADALFEIGSYRKHLLLVDYVIECSITITSSTWTIRMFFITYCSEKPLRCITPCHIIRQTTLSCPCLR